MPTLRLILWLALVAPAALAADIEAPGPNGPLKGTFLAGDGPAALIIPGSGPTDRDGNNPFGMTAAPYRLLAEGLARRGIASARIDKRGMFASAAAVPDANAVTVEDYVADTRAWIDVLRRRTGASCVWLVGHSEGGIVALATAARRPDAICGLVLVAAPGRPVGEVLKAQFRANPDVAPLVAAAEQAIDRLSVGRTVDAAALPRALRALFRPEIQGFLVSLFALDPARLIRAVGIPILILQGGRDIQVGEADARRLADAAPAARLVLLPEANHVLKRVATDDRADNLAAYGDPDRPLAPGVIEAIADFVRTVRR